MRVARGDVVLVGWPFSDLTGRKRRPAVVVQIDSLNALISDTVLIQVTGRTRSAATEVVLDPSAEPQSGLSRVSYAVCNHFLTLDQALVHQKLGTVSAAAMRQIEGRIKSALGLP